MSYFFNFDKIAYLQGEKPEGCILCMIKDNSERVVKLIVYEDELLTATVNLYPYNPGHLIIFPNRHIEDIRMMTDEENIHLFQIKKQALTILDRVYNPDGYNIGYNMGLAAGASIEHLHIHIIPRYPTEAGIADLIAGKKLLVESPLVTMEKLKKEFNRLHQV